MPFYANTPESLLKRSDSLDPATTCRGVTGSGKPCRRALVTELPAVPIPKRNKKRAPTDLTDVSLYCWQHQDQAARHTVSDPGPRLSSSLRPHHRSSIDTLSERLGLTDLASDGRPSRPQQNEPAKTFSFCCFTIPLEDFGDDVPPSRPGPRPLQQTSPASRPNRVSASPSRPRPSTSSNAAANSPGRVSNTGQTGIYLSLIPPSASPQTASSLMAELAKPISKNDEAGYIYIFWLTPENEPAAQPKESARDLLAPPTSDPRGAGQRRPSDVLAAFANTAFDTWFDNNDDDSATSRSAPRNADADRERRVKGKKAGKKTILLKIGRATNVQRRLNEWQRQCGYNLSLVRYYPYVSSSTPSATPRKMPHSHKVERLIHIELGGAGLRVLDGEKCDACGREHREWFEIEATRNAVREVDEVVKRWVEWDETSG